MKNDINAETSECYSTFVNEFTVNTLSVESTCSINLLKFVNWNIWIYFSLLSGSLVVLTNNKQSYQQWLHYPSSSKYNRACSAL